MDKQMYINRKDGTLVEAEIRTDNYGGNPYWCITHNGKQEFLNEPEFEAQYGEAMICPDKVCYRFGMCNGSQPHLCSKHQNAYNYHCPKCIPYIPEEQKADNEPTFPICGTCNARKEQSNLSKLMLTSEQLNEVVWRYTDKENQTYALGTIIKEIAKAQISHLAKPDMGIYKKISTTCPTCGGGGFGKYLEPCNHCKGEGDFVKYIPLSDYLKGEKKE
jgi:hypothetical protein